MADKENSFNIAAANARQKRRKILQERNLDRQLQNDVINKHSPLLHLSSITINKHSETESSNFENVQCGIRNTTSSARENECNVRAANARMKRRLKLQEKNSHRTFGTNISNSATPLSQAVSTRINQEQCQSQYQSPHLHTQPSQSNHGQQRTRTHCGMESVAVNLLHRYNENHETFPEDNVSVNPTTHNMHQSSVSNIDMSTVGPVTETTFETTEDEGHICSEDSSTSDEDNISNTDNTHLQYSTTLEGYSDIGDPITQCCHCQALMWYQERIRKDQHTANPKFHLCCGVGKVQLPFLNPPPPLLKQLLFGSDHPQSKNYQQNIRAYNMMFAFTSPGIDVDHSLNNGHGPPNLRVHGQACHKIGSLLPPAGKQPKFAQLYIYDTENEVRNRMETIRRRNKIDAEIVSNLSIMLDQHNTHAKSFRMARQCLADGNVQNLKLQLISDRKKDGRVYNIPTVSEVAAIIVGDIHTAPQRDIIMQTQSGQLQRIHELHPSYLGFQYPLLFPYGEDGYRQDVLHRQTSTTATSKRIRLTIREWLCFRLQMRTNEAETLLRSRRLFQQFVVDGYLMLESERLSFIRHNQSKLRVDKYSNLSAPASTQQSQGSMTGKRVILPSTFVGGRRYMDQLYFDGMAICSHVGFPDLFITFTCNPCWPEIERLLGPLNLKASDRPDIVSRVFRIKFEELLYDLTKKNILGAVVAYIYTIEFQKRGLPHAHLLLFLHPSHKYPTPAQIDSIISAEIPDEYEAKELHKLVKSHMIHGPCGLANRSSPCMKNGKCTRYYPKKFQAETIVDQDGFPVYKRSNNGRTIQKNGVILDNRSVVPYSPTLLLKYQAHVNMEWCNQSTSIKYLFKYIHKGYDRITAAIVQDEHGYQEETAQLDEVKHYLDCRYISPAEACWRIMSFPIHSRKPAVERMFFHLPGEQAVYFHDDDAIDDVLNKPSISESMFTSWLNANKIYPEGKTLTYAQFVSKFVYVKKDRIWKPRKNGYTIGRLIWVHPNSGELFYLRMMLTVAKGPTSYEDIRTVKNVQHATFKEACFAMGFLDDDKEYIAAIKESKDWGSAHYLRKLFVTLLVSGTINRPEYVWEHTWKWLADDIVYQQRIMTGIQDLELGTEECKNLCLLQIEKLLEKCSKSLRDYPFMPYPDGFVSTLNGNRFIYSELDYDVAEMNTLFQRNYTLLTGEQKEILQKIMKAVSMQKGGFFFLYGYGGTGKTFMWQTLSAALRKDKHIVLTVASSGIASLLLPGGRTAHSKFKIPVPTLDDSLCNIHQGSELAQLFKMTKLIIWDEAPMAHKYCFEALDKSLRDIMGFNNNPGVVFGGKVVVLGGDFRQILPVIPRANRSDIVHATINSSYLWDFCEVLTLTQNMRLQCGLDNTSIQELQNFSNWILQVGDGKAGERNDGYATIEIPKEFLVTQFDDPIAAIVSATYPNLVDNFSDETFLQSRAVLACTIEIVDLINEYVISLIPGEERVFFSSDSIDKSDSVDNQCWDAITTEFLNSLRTSGLPNHNIKLKVGTPIMLLRNIDQSEGLCNGTRLVVQKIGHHVIQAKVMSSTQDGAIIYIPRMSLSPSQSPWPFKLIRRQFPITISYAMTINKSQGQSLIHVGLYLPKPVFSHGQLYVAISRVRSKSGLKILIHDCNNKPLTSTTNVVFKEVFQNLTSG